MNKPKMKLKTENEALKNPEASETLAPANACVTARAELIDVLSQFNFTIEAFDRKRSDSYEQQLAARSPRLLEQLYLGLLKPGISYKVFQKECPRWPEGHPLAGRFPNNSTVRLIASRLAAARKADPAINWERRKLVAREKDLRLREAQLALEREKIHRQLQSGQPAPAPSLPGEAYDPEIEQQKVIALTKKIYGDDIFN